MELFGTSFTITTNPYLFRTTDFLAEEVIAEHTAGRAHPLEQFIGMISDEEAEEMQSVIKSDCRQIDWDEWK